MVLSSALGFSRDDAEPVPFSASAVNSPRSRAWALFLNSGWEWVALRFHFYRPYILNNEYLKIPVRQSAQVLVVLADTSQLVKQGRKKSFLSVYFEFGDCFGVVKRCYDITLILWWCYEFYSASFLKKVINLMDICMSLAVNGCECMYFPQL